MRSSRSVYLCRLAVVLFLLSASGCGARTGTVAGKVLLDGKPVPGGYVNFFPQGENTTAKSSPIDKDGNYTVIGVPTGSVKISVQGIFGSEQLPNMKGPNGMDMPRSDRKTVYVPTKYSTVEESGLSYDVKPGSQDFNIELKDR